MSTRWSRGVSGCLSILVLLSLVPDSLLAQAVQDGKWKVTQASPTVYIYYNLSGAAQKVQLTVCATSGNRVLVVGPGFSLDVTSPNCRTTTVNLVNFGIVHVDLEAGEPSSVGTYSITILP